MKSPILKATLVQETFSMEEKHDVIAPVVKGGLKMHDLGGLVLCSC